MSRSTILKFIIPLLLVLAIALGFLQGRGNFYFGPSTQTFYGPDKNLVDYLTEGLNLRQKNQTATTTFLAVGDIMFSRNVAATIEKAKNPSLPFVPLTPLFQSVNFSFGNLETPIASSTAVIGGHSLVFSSPWEYVSKLKDYNFQILNLANNHAFDQGLEGLTYTKKILDDNNIQHEGTGENLDEAWQPAIVETNGIKICFIGASYASVNDSGKTKNNYVARIEDVDHLKKSIDDAKSECDFTVATMHAGTEYTRKPNADQITFAHTAIDDGADIVIGAHPHWIQTIENYQGKYIFYSLGNFIFDQMWSQDTKEGLTLKIQVFKNQESTLQGPRTAAKLDSIELIPVIIENYSTPRLATANETKKILLKIGQAETILK